MDGRGDEKRFGFGSMCEARPRLNTVAYYGNHSANSVQSHKPTTATTNQTSQVGTLLRLSSFSR
jgi:hypothetical protein